jgi:hypothetical protein
MFGWLIRSANGHLGFQRLSRTGLDRQDASRPNNILLALRWAMWRPKPFKPKLRADAHILQLYSFRRQRCHYVECPGFVRFERAFKKHIGWAFAFAIAFVKCHPQL